MSRACNAYESSYPGAGASFRSVTDNNTYSRNAVCARTGFHARNYLRTRLLPIRGRNVKLGRVSATAAASLYIDLPRTRCTHRERARSLHLEKVFRRGKRKPNRRGCRRGVLSMEKRSACDRAADFPRYRRYLAPLRFGRCQQPPPPLVR